MNAVERDKVVQAICDQYARDGVRPEHVEIRANGEIIVDRRASHPCLVPVVVGRWK